MFSWNGWMIRNLIPGKGKRIFSSPKRPNQLWIPFSLLFGGYRASFPVSKAVGSVRLTTPT